MSPKLTWIIEHEWNDEVKNLVKEIKKQEFKVEILSREAVYGLNTGTSVQDDNHQCILYYGSLGTAGMIRRQFNWVPGIYSDLSKYACSYYYPRLGEYPLNSNYVILPYGDLLRRKDWLYQHIGVDDTLFIRPDGGNKTFTGQLVYEENFNKDVEYFGFNQISPEDLVVVCEPRYIDKEWRFVVVDGSIITGSQYKPERKCISEYSDDDVEAFAFASTVLKTTKFSPESAWVLDICSAGARMYVLEIGCFSCAGFYECDLERVVREVSRVAMRDYHETIQ